MKTTKLLVGLVGIVICASIQLTRADDVFTFAGFTFDQRNAPNQGSRLGNNANLGGAVFSAGFATTATTDPIDFPQGGSGFNTNLSLAQLSGLKAGLYAVNLPNGNNGTTTRHGIEVWWSNGRGIDNLAGADFVVFESASSIAGVEGLMARVRTNWLADIWTDWFYFAPTNFQITMSTNGCHPYGFDASNMGVANGASFDRIQIANLTQADRISGTSTNVGGTLVGEGKVVFDGSTLVFPDAGTYDSDHFFASDQFDPDPLYLASLRVPCEVVAPQVEISRAGTQVNLFWPAPSCFVLQATTTLLASNTVWASVGTLVSQTNGYNIVAITATNDARFFRLAKP
jgi:hypothetical protein